MLKMAGTLGLAVVLLAGGGRAAAQDTRPARTDLSEDERILLVLSRFTPGPTAALVSEVRAQGLASWLETQLKGNLPEPDALRSRLRQYETLTLDGKDLADRYLERPGKDATPADKAKARHLASIPGKEMLDGIVLRAVYGDNLLREASADFLRNHFSVSMDKKQVRFLVVDWERSVILARALGNFGDLLEATAKHPCMLHYLDNAISRKPATPLELSLLEAQTRKKAAARKEDDEDEDAKVRQALDLAKQRGLNENYARELMELHTLGVDHYYTQSDVQEVAKCLTGWTVQGRGQEGGSFRFAPLMHCPGDKHVLGQVIHENRANPLLEGEQVLDILKNHEGTARFLSWKLCRWFVNDAPDEAMVTRVSDVFRKTGGDLPAVFRAILNDPHFFVRENFRIKYKRPFEFVISALRATGAEVSHSESILKTLTSMNEPLYHCGAPTGYYDQAESWADPGSMAARWTFADDLASGKLAGVRIPASFYADLDAARPESWKDKLVSKILPVSGVGAATSNRIDALVAAEVKRNAKGASGRAGPLIVALLLGSPDFQRQ